MEDLLENPNTPPEILQEYTQKAITEGAVTYELRSVLKNPKFFDFLRQRGEHTAEEIVEGIGDLTQSEVGETLNAITDIGEPQKDPHNLE